MGGARWGPAVAETSGASGASHVDAEPIGALVADIGADGAAEVCRLFLADVDVHLDSLHAACASRDAGAATRTAHRLKSASGFVGLSGISRLCLEIEQLAPQGWDDAVRSRVERLVDALERAAVELAAYAGSPAGPDRGAGAGG